MKRRMILFLGMMAAMYSMAGSVYAEVGIDPSYARNRPKEAGKGRKQGKII